MLRSLLGDVAFAQGDYVFVPRGLLHRFLPAGPQHWFWFSLTGGLHVPDPVAQRGRPAPHGRALLAPRLQAARSCSAPLDEGIRELVVRRGGAWHGFTLDRLAARRRRLGRHGLPVGVPDPRVPAAGQLGPPAADLARHVRRPRRADLQLRPPPGRLPPRGDPLPLPARSTHCDEIIFYCDGNFTSRQGVGPGSISHHPMGVPHGPHPGSYEKSIGATRDRRARRHARHLRPAARDPGRALGRGPGLPGLVPVAASRPRGPRARVIRSPVIP